MNETGDVLMRLKAAVIGAGSMGTAVSILLANNGHHVDMWTRYRDDAEKLNFYRENTDKLPGAKLPANVVCSDDMERVLHNADLAVFAVPSQALRETAAKAVRFLTGRPVIATVTKGLEMSTCLRMSEVLSQEIEKTRLVILSGPCHAEELAKGIPTAYVAASDDLKLARFVQDAFMAPVFRVYTATDVTGVEMGGALKNVIALCAGISDGLGFGDNTRAALMTRGIAEITRLGTKVGAKPETFAGLTGVGDVIVTCTSMHSRNRRAGILIGQGKSLDEALAEVKMVVEGVYTAKAAYELAKRKNVSMPITTEAYKVLFEGKDPKEAVVELMTRDKKSEMELVLYQ